MNKQKTEEAEEIKRSALLIGQETRLSLQQHGFDSRAEYNARYSSIGRAPVFQTGGAVRIRYFAQK